MSPDYPQTVRLGLFAAGAFARGRSRLVEAVWMCVQAGLVGSWLPGSRHRVALLRLFGARIGNGVVVKPGVRVKFPWRLSMGDHCWIGERAWIDNLAAVTLGDDVCISQGAYLCTGNHDWSDPAFALITRPITLLDGSWVGAKALIAPGVTLGVCAVASAGSVITKSIPDFEIHAGNPAAPVRQRQITPCHKFQPSITSTHPTTS